MTTGAEMGRPIEILLVEDNPGDVDLAREGLADGKVRNNLHVAEDGEEAPRSPHPENHSTHLETTHSVLSATCSLPLG